MTNTESRIAVGLEAGLAAHDDADVGNEEQQIAEDDIRELAAYSFDSDKLTLVGLGPVERARRSRKTNAIPDPDCMPPSQPPGPFIADDDELPPSLRGRKLSSWAVVVPSLLVVAAAISLVVRGLAHDVPGPSRPAAAAAVAVAPLPATEQAAKPKEPASEPVTAVETPLEPVTAVETPPEPVTSVDSPPEPNTQRSAPVAATPPVTLPELPSPTVVAAPNAASSGVGNINVTSTPPANVVLDGRPIGMAPRVVQVPAGIHTVLFIHPLYGRQSLSVNVTAGASTGASADF